MRSDKYYEDELLYLVEQWSVEQVEDYIVDLQARVKNTQGQIRALHVLVRRKKRNDKLKDTGTRGGK